jgi:6-pyruvoyltetrahydropterin/6-carboxytetrahydropterin synthase
MTHTIRKTFEFAASHQLAGLPEGHKCVRLHGHSYQLTVEVVGELDEVGFVIDFGDLAWIGDLVSSTLDHRHLNEVLDVNPTSENLATWILQRFSAWFEGRPERVRVTELAVTVFESRTSSASERLLLR